MSDWVEGSYKIVGTTENKTRDGFTNGTFGVTREEDGMCVVTHLASGRKLDFLSMKSMDLCKSIAGTLAEKYDWEGESADEIAERNGMSKKEFKSAVEGCFS